MPTTTTISNLTPAELRVADRLVATDGLVKLGKRAVQPGRVVADRYPGLKNWNVATTDVGGGDARTASVDPETRFTVSRDVPTEKELAEVEAAAQAREVARHQRRLLHDCQDAYNLLGSTRQRLIAMVDAGVSGVRLADYVFSVAEAEAVWEVAERILTLTGETVRDSEPMDILTAAKRVAISVASQLLERGADDQWSGRGNDVRRAQFDAQRKFVRELRWSGVQVFDTDHEFL
jgi:hypothetical protein